MRTVYYLTVYYLTVSIHILAAFVWLGGMFFLAAVGAPVLRRLDSPELRRTVFRQIGEQFRLVGWIAIAILLLTGVLNLYFRGLLAPETLGSRAFWGTRSGPALAWKLVIVAAMLVASALHDFLLGPAASRLDPRSPQGLAARRRATWFARGNALLGVSVVYAAVVLARG